MKIINILITILSTIVIYLIFKNYNNKKIEKFTKICTASLTDWEKISQIPSGKKITGSNWNPLRTKLLGSNTNIVSFSLKDDLFLDMNNVLDYTIDINDYIEINNDDSIEYWKPIKEWKEGVISHFCKELCILKLGYEWIKTDNITNLIELSNDIGEDKTIRIKQLIKTVFDTIPSSTYSTLTHEYVKLNTVEFDNIIGSSYINDNNYITFVDGTTNTYYKVAANIPIGRKWKVYEESGSYDSTEKDGILENIAESNVIHFNNLNVSVGDIIILTESNYNLFFNAINLTEKYVIHPDRQGKCFMPELFEYDKCYQKSCTLFTNKEFDDYLKLINLRESMGYKTTSFEYTKDIMHNSDNKLLDLVNQLQTTVNNRIIRGNCTTSSMINKLIEVIKVGEYVRYDNSTNVKCPKTYDPYTYVEKPTRTQISTYTDICNDLDFKEYRKKINPEIYKYITTEWIDKPENSSYNFEKNWDVIKENIDLSKKYGNDSLKNKVISKNQLTELILKYLDDIEYLLHVNHRKPGCYSNGYCDGTGIIIENPNTQKLMDSNNNELDDIIELYTDKNSHKWEEVQETSNAKVPRDNLGIELSNGTREFNKNKWQELGLDIEPITINDIYKYNGIYYQYLGLLPIYITMGKVSENKYIEITTDNIQNVGEPNAKKISKTQCNENLITKIDENKKNKLDEITKLTKKYYDDLLKDERVKINTLKEEINNINTDITKTYGDLCSKYENDYKLYSEYNLIKFIKNTSITGKFDLNELAQKTIKLKEIDIINKNKKFNKQTSELLDQCTLQYECRNIGPITGKKADLLKENLINNEIIISLNDFYRIVDKVNILENDYLLYDTKWYKIFEIDNGDIHSKINNDFSKKSYPQEYTYTYNDFISINIDLHDIDIDNQYYIRVNDTFDYELNMDSTFKRFITNYKSIYDKITDIDLTKNEKCINKDGEELFFANHNAIIKGNNPCSENNSCKDDTFEKEYTKIQYANLQTLNNTKKLWNDNNYSTDYDNIYKEAVGGYDDESLKNTHSNFWKNKYHNEIQCPTNSEGKSIKVNGLYYVNPDYNYGLKWKKLQSDIDTSGKKIIEIYDNNVLINTSLDNNEIDFTNDQNNIRFKDNNGDIIDMSSIDETYYLMIINNGKNNYYKVYGTNKCSSSQICSSKSNDDYMNDFNEKVRNIENDQLKCDDLYSKYSNYYTEKPQKYYENGIDDITLTSYYPEIYDDNYVYSFE